jgi:hypothetical protein
VQHDPPDGKQAALAGAVVLTPLIRPEILIGLLTRPVSFVSILAGAGAAVQVIALRSIFLIGKRPWLFA